MVQSSPPTLPFDQVAPCLRVRRQVEYMLVRILVERFDCFAPVSALGRLVEYMSVRTCWRASFIKLGGCHVPLVPRQGSTSEPLHPTPLASACPPWVRASVLSRISSSAPGATAMQAHHPVSPPSRSEAGQSCIHVFSRGAKVLQAAHRYTCRCGWGCPGRARSALARCVHAWWCCARVLVLRGCFFSSGRSRACKWAGHDVDGVLCLSLSSAGWCRPGSVQCPPLCS
eukprot:11325785-Alexandrium_andersonii.AAC.1